jgi:transcription-repair coupling factor (superfamily II helicase)
VKDCILETDLEVRIPDDYVNNVAERLSLYQEMDSLKNEEALQKFAEMLIDRFGPLPIQVNELVLSFKLRWLAQDMGLERLVIKSGKMVGYFITDPQSHFYETETFTRVLNHIQKNGHACKLSEQNDRLRIIFSDVRHIRHAYEQIGNILEIPLSL